MEDNKEIKSLDRKEDVLRILLRIMLESKSYHGYCYFRGDSGIPVWVERLCVKELQDDPQGAIYQKVDSIIKEELDACFDNASDRMPKKREETQNGRGKMTRKALKRQKVRKMKEEIKEVLSQLDHALDIAGTTCVSAGSGYKDLDAAAEKAKRIQIKNRYDIRKNSVLSQCGVGEELEGDYGYAQNVLAPRLREMAFMNKLARHNNIKEFSVDECTHVNHFLQRLGLDEIKPGTMFVDLVEEAPRSVGLDVFITDFNRQTKSLSSNSLGDSISRFIVSDSEKNLKEYVKCLLCCYDQGYYSSCFLQMHFFILGLFCKERFVNVEVTSQRAKLIVSNEMVLEFTWIDPLYKPAFFIKCMQSYTIDSNEGHYCKVWGAPSLRFSLAQNGSYYRHHELEKTMCHWFATAELGVMFKNDEQCFHSLFRGGNQAWNSFIESLESGSGYVKKTAASLPSQRTCCMSMYIGAVAGACAAAGSGYLLAASVLLACHPIILVLSAALLGAVIGNMCAHLFCGSLASRGPSLFSTANASLSRPQQSSLHG